MWHVVLAGLAGGIPGIFTSYLITGVLFHPFQRHTPATWRVSESPARYAAAGALKVVAGIFIAFLVCLSIGIQDFGGPVPLGIVIGLVVWAAAALPALTSAGLFINLHPGFVIGLLLDWMVVCVVAGGVSAWMQAG